MRLKTIAVTSLIVLSLTLTACGKKEAPVDTNNPEADIELDSFINNISPSNEGKTLGEILGTAETPEPTAPEETTDLKITLPTQAITSTDTAEPTDIPETDSTELAEDLFNLLNQNSTATDLTVDNLLAIDAMNIFANNIKNANYFEINKTLREFQLNMRECTVLSRVSNGSIIKFRSEDDVEVQTTLVMYVTDLTAWTVMSDDNTIYALMPTPEGNSTEYEKQIMIALMETYSNGKDLDIQLLYPVLSVFDETNNCAVYTITTDGTFNVGSNANTYAFYKYDYVK